MCPPPSKSPTTSPWEAIRACSAHPLLAHTRLLVDSSTTKMYSRETAIPEVPTGGGGTLTPSLTASISNTWIVCQGGAGYVRCWRPPPMRLLVGPCLPLAWCCYFGVHVGGVVAPTVRLWWSTLASNLNEISRKTNSSRSRLVIHLLILVRVCVHLCARAAGP